VQKAQFFGAICVGLLSVVAQIAVFYVRFGTWNAHSTVLDYILFFVAGRYVGRIDFVLFSKPPNFKNSTVCNFARFSAGLAYCFGYDDQRRFARSNWRVGLSTNPLDTVCVAGGAGGKFLVKK
jgi:hypothetical protein